MGLLASPGRAFVPHTLTGLLANRPDGGWRMAGLPAGSAAPGLAHGLGAGDAPVPDAGDQRPGIAPGLRVEAGGELVQHGDLRVADQGKRHRKPLPPESLPNLVPRFSASPRPDSRSSPLAGSG
jgi:hypothetical protein